MYPTCRCSFCAFSKGKAAEALRGPAYVVPLEEISRRAEEAWERGATEASGRVCLCLRVSRARVCVHVCARGHRHRVFVTFVLMCLCV